MCLAFRRKRGERTYTKACPRQICLLARPRRYAADIYRLQQAADQEPLILVKDVVEASAQAIARMIKRLGQGGYLVHVLY